VVQPVDLVTPPPDDHRNTRRAEYSLRWVLAHEPPVVFDEAARVFENHIREKSSGDIDVELYRIADYAARRGRPTMSREELVASVQRGDIEMAHCYTSALGAVHDRLWAIELPFLFRSYAHADAVWEGPVARQLMAGMSEVGLRGIAFAYSGGFRIVPTRDRQISSLADFRGLRLRTAGNPVPELLYRKLGGSATGAPLEAIADLQRAGKIDGCEITFVRYQACGLDSVFPVINVTGHSLFTTMTVVNDAWFCRLPDRHQTTIVEAGEAACRVERETAIRQEQTTRADLAARGLTIVDLGDAARAELRAVASEVQRELAPRFGESLVAAIHDAATTAPS